MSAVWIDFKELQRKLDFAKVLRHYGVELKPKKQGRQHVGFCPLPTHNGKRRSPSFSADLKRGIWKCFGFCQDGGDILRFAAIMEGLDPDRGEDIRETAIKLMNALGIDCDSPPTGAKRTRRRGIYGGEEYRNEHDEDDELEAESEPEKNAGQAATCPALVNAPLNFQLQGLDPSHPYLKERGLTQETIAYFGLGYCSRGLMQGRIAIPLHDKQGQLVGYAGRLIDDSLIDEDHPKYLFPSAREREGKRYEFRKSLLLYNGFQMSRLRSDLIVVEGFPSVWWLWQNGFENVVAVMGSDCSDEQARLIVSKVPVDRRIYLMPDGNAAGVHCAHVLLQKLAAHRWVRWIRLKESEQPTDLHGDGLRSRLDL